MMPLQDRFGRTIEYLRLSVTDRCDLRCFYCLPSGFRDFQDRDQWLNFDEIERVVAAFAALGVRRVRITGGEPLVRKSLTDLVGRLNALPGIEDLSLSTNCTRMARFAEPLKAAGVTRINVSLDSLQPKRFERISGGRLDAVIDGLMAAKAAGFAPIKVNMVMLADTNEDEAEDMLAFCAEHGFTLRFIETMPVGETGREASRRYVDLQHVRRRLEQTFELIPTLVPGGGPADYAQLAGTDIKVGFITPMSRHFCDTCNRVRMTPDGALHMCLGQTHSYALRGRLRAGLSDHELCDALRDAIELKPRRHSFNSRPEHVLRYMALTGG